MAGLRIKEKESYVEFDVIARPGSSKNAVLGVHDNAVRIGISAAPEKGKANETLIKFLSKELGVTQAQIEIVSGSGSRRKRVRVNGIDGSAIMALAGKFLK